MTEDLSWVPPGVDTGKASIARVYDYWLGGTHNFEADRDAARALIAVGPQARGFARENRAFLGRAVRFLADAGIRQFLDIGSGIPTQGNVHEIAQAAAPEARVVYADIDPVAVAHSRAILTGHDRAAVIQGDLRDGTAILAAPEVGRLLDFSEPVGLLLGAVLHFITDEEDPWQIVAALGDKLAPGSYLVVSHVTSAGSPPAMTAAFENAYQRRVAGRGKTRSVAEVERFFGGFELVEPGVVFLPQWRPDPGTAATDDSAWVSALAGVGRKPAGTAHLPQAAGAAAGDLSWVPPGVDTAKASVARVYDYWLGGTHNFQADRDAARALIAVAPEARGFARENRAFLARAVRLAVADGVRQFLDLGSGIPTQGNVHEIAQAAAPGAKVVYVDIDPVAAAHSRVILAGNDDAGVLQADLRDAGTILASPEVRRLIDFGRPVGLLLGSVLHFVADDEDPWGIVATFCGAMTPGSYLIISHATTEGRPQELTAAYQTAYNRTVATQGQPRSRAAIERFFDGFDLLEPGLVFPPAWRPDPAAEVPGDLSRFLVLAGAGRKI